MSDACKRHGRVRCDECREMGELRQRLAAAEAVIDTCLEQFRSFAKDWDCDSDAHKYGTPCRACESDDMVQMIEAAKAGGGDE